MMNLEPDYEIVVIGAGPSGIGAGVKLRQQELTDFLILERTTDVGGSWRDNDYPGIGIDVPSFTYQYSFAKNRSWSRLFPKGSEVHEYHARVAREYGLFDHIRFGVSVVREVWDEGRHLWHIATDDGETVTARFVINAVGAYINPKSDPGIPGHKDFAGKIMRPTEWDHSYDLTGKRVGVIGTGASSVQIVPSIAPASGDVLVFQRTPVWCLPKPDLEFGRVTGALMSTNWFQSLLSGGALLLVELLTRILVYAPPLIANPVMRMMDGAARAAYRGYLRTLVNDPQARRDLAPAYGVLGKRPTISNDFLQAFNRDNVSLITTSIERITETGIRTADGVDHDLDVLVLATGYELFSDPEAYRRGAVVGRDGLDLGEFYAANGLQAYQAVSVAGLPNRWTIIGPYSWTGTGWHFMIETALTHALRAIREAGSRGATAVEVRADAMRRYHAMIKRNGRNIDHYFRVQNRGLRTYYVNSHGDTPYIRPSTVLKSKHDAGAFPLDDYEWRRVAVDAAGYPGDEESELISGVGVK